MQPAPQTETWDLWQDGTRPPWENMALDEALLETAPARPHPLLRFYRWEQNAITIGYVQRYAAAPLGYPVVRRPTGGGVVYHDHDFTYSVIIPAGHWLHGVERTKSYEWINRAVREGLIRLRVAAVLARDDTPGSVDRSTMVCFENPTRYDILAGKRKVAGSAQRRKREGILHQGSIHFGGKLPVEKKRIAEALIQGFHHVLAADLKPFLPTAHVWNKARQLGEEKYRNDAWNRRR